MSSSRKDPEEQLKEAVKSLHNPPTATDELLKLLDEVENLLSNVEQAPSISMQEALVPLMTALISNKFLRNSDADVKVSVASCMTEITRITAPDAPYNDETMKEIFQLTVAAFERLSHLSGRWYTKAVTILKVVAKIRSSVMMLDLGCDSLILEMFQHFLNLIQSDHPLAVFSDMQTIMSTVLNEFQEGEEMPLDLLQPLLSSVRKENQNVSPFSWKLGETVIDNCSAKLKPYLMEAVKSTGFPLDGYARIVAAICQNGSDGLKHGHVNESEKNVVTEGVTLDAREANQSMADPSNDKPDVVNAREGSFSLKAIESETHTHSAAKKKGKRPSSSLNPDKNSVVEPYSALIRRGRKPNSLMNPDEGYENYWMHSERKTPRSDNIGKCDEKGTSTLPTEDHLCGKVTSSSPLPLNFHNVTEPGSSQLQTEGDIVPSSPVPQNSHHDGTQSRRGRPKKQVTIAHQEANPAFLSATTENILSAHAEEKIEDINLKIESKETSTVKAKSRGRPRKLPAKTNDESVLASVHVGTEKESAVPLNLEEKQQQCTAIKLETGKINDQSDTQNIESRNVSVTKPRGRPRKITGNTKETVLALESEEKVSAIPCDIDEKNPQQQSVLQLRTGSISDQSGVRNGIKKHRMDDNSSKESTEISCIKNISKSRTKREGDKNVVEETPEMVRKRKRSIGMEEASPMADPDEKLIGCQVKVWWPADKTFYEGVVCSYNASKKKHVVLYTDGEQESLNLRKQRWQMIGGHLPDVSLTLSQKNYTPKADASDRSQKRKRKTKSESSKQANADLAFERLSKTGASAGTSTIECIKSGNNSAYRCNESEVKDKQQGHESKEIEVLGNDDGDICAGKFEAETKSGNDSMQIEPEVILSN